MYIQEINDKNLWESFITKHSPQSLFQSWNWGEAIKIRNSKFKIKNLWRLGLYENKNLVAIAQVNKVIAKRGRFLHLRHGPIFFGWTKELFDYLLNYLKDLGKKEKVAFLRISPLIENTKENRDFIKSFGFFSSPIHAMDGEYCWVIDLSKSESELLANTRKTARYLIKQAEKLEVAIVKSKKESDLGEFLSLYRQTAKRQHFIEHKGIVEEFHQFLKDDQILLFKGYYQKKLLSTALIVFYNHQAIYHHSASVEQRIPVNYLLQWEVILEAKRRNKLIYNLWGIAPEDNPRHPWQGLTLFKKGFGGRSQEFLHAQDLPFSFKYCTTYIIETARKIWKGY